MAGSRAEQSRPPAKLVVLTVRTGGNIQHKKMFPLLLKLSYLDCHIRTLSKMVKFVSEREDVVMNVMEIHVIIS